MTTHISTHYRSGIEIRSVYPENSNSICLEFTGGDSIAGRESGFSITAFNLPVEVTDTLKCAFPANKLAEITPPTPLEFTKMVIRRFGKPDPAGPFSQYKDMAETLLATALCDCLGDDHPLADIITQFRMAEAAHIATNNQYTSTAINDCRAEIEESVRELDTQLAEYEAKADEVKTYEV